MPSANLASYLAKNYLTASNARDSSQEETISSDFQDSTRPKKKRRKNRDESTPGGLVIADDEDLSLSRKNRAEGAEDEDIPTFETSVKSAEFRKKKGGSGWKVVSTGATTTQPPEEGSRHDEDAEADRILAEAEEESRLRRQEIETDDAPAIVEDVSSDATPRMQS